MTARIAVPLLLLAALAACNRERGAPADQATESVTAEEMRQARAELPAPLRAQLDSGNAAYSERRYPEALRHYQQATRLDDNVPAAWFGVYMAQNALGNAKAADEAMRRAREAAPDASLVHPGGPADTTPAAPGGAQ